MTISDYIKKRLNDIKEEKKKQLLENFKKENTDEGKLSKRIKAYKESEEFGAQLQALLDEDEQYAILSSPDAESSEMVIKRYNGYIRKKKKQARRVEIGGLKKEISSYPVQIDLDGFQAEIESALEDYLSGSVIRFDNKSGIRRELKSAHAEMFLDCIKDGMGAYILNPCMKLLTNGKIKDIGDAAVQWLILSDDDLRAIIYVKKSMLIPVLKRHPEVKRAAVEALERLKISFDEKRILSLVMLNSRYSDMIKKAKEDIELEKAAQRMIVREIPKNPIDLYPNARKIKRHFVLHIGPTNSGKTYDALQCFYKADKGIYLAPLRLLAYEIFEQTNVNGVPCSMRTGEEHIEVPFSTHDARTVEMLDDSVLYDVAVIDEAQLISDEERGGAWTAAVLGVFARNVQVCAAPEAESIIIKLIELCGDTYEVVRHERSVPLKPDKRRFSFPDSVRDKDALIVFSKRSVLACAAVLQQSGIKASVIYGALPYDVRQNEVRRFINEETDVVVATDAIGMGLNLPVQRVVFLETQKFDGKRKRPLTSAEVQQIAGRAGRRGIYDVGYYTVEYGSQDIESKMNTTVAPIRRARLDFPKTLINVDMPLTKIMTKWNEMPDNDIFIKSSLETELRLCKVLETLTEDKDMIYTLVTIPFNESSSEVYFMWLTLAREFISGRRTPEKELIQRIRDEYAYFDELEKMEMLYQKCDLLYYYFTRFGLSERADEVCRLKKDISNKIIQILSRQQLEPKRCKDCGTQLPWNYPYKYCDECFAFRKGQDDSIEELVL